MKLTIRFLSTLFALGLVVSACGDDPVPIAEAPEVDTTAADDDTTTPDEEAPADDAAAPDEAGAVVDLGASDLGEILVDAGGLTLYGFTDDTDATSTCFEACADAWPPIIVDPDFVVGAGLDPAVFSTTERPDGSLQLVAGIWPLYLFAGDGAAGDLNGQGSGDVWFVVSAEGALVGAAPAESADGAADDESAAPSSDIVGVGETTLGEVLVDAAGLSLYGFLDDVDGEPACYDACADAWPPVLVDGAELPAGLDDGVFSVAARTDGTHQLRAGAWPLYLFAGDAAPGDVNGQDAGGVWFLAAPDGSLVGAPQPAAAEAAPDY